MSVIQAPWKQWRGGHRPYYRRSGNDWRHRKDEHRGQWRPYWSWRGFQASA